ncbi:hypothetical protein SDC9_212180 [bioreactor metagenome]|uniref:Uncharacterized protein n=1 Tax=bioreactor metagenome TaxID=1076179 RepID=A0A645JL56_9ZZZZ
MLTSAPACVIANNIVFFMVSTLVLFFVVVTIVTFNLVPFSLIITFAKSFAMLTQLGQSTALTLGESTEEP